MRHRPFTILSALSLVLCAALLITWLAASFHANRSLSTGPLGDRNRWSILVGVWDGTLTLDLSVPSSDPTSPPLAIASGNTYTAWISANMRPREYARWGFAYTVYPTKTSKSSVLVPEYGPIASHTAGIYTIPSHAHRLKVPCWFLLLLTATPWLACIVMHRRRTSRQWRLTHGLCLSCGYDLRASKDRCPECGTATPALMAGSDGGQWWEGVTC